MNKNSNFNSQFFSHQNHFHDIKIHQQPIIQLIDIKAQYFRLYRKLSCILLSVRRKCHGKIWLNCGSYVSFSHIWNNTINDYINNATANRRKEEKKVISASYFYFYVSSFLFFVCLFFYSCSKFLSIHSLSSHSYCSVFISLELKKVHSYRTDMTLQTLRILSSLQGGIFNDFFYFQAHFSCWDSLELNEHVGIGAKIYVYLIQLVVSWVWWLEVFEFVVSQTNLIIFQKKKNPKKFQKFIYGGR